MRTSRITIPMACFVGGLMLVACEESTLRGPVDASAGGDRPRDAAADVPASADGGLDAQGVAVELGPAGDLSGGDRGRDTSRADTRPKDSRSDQAPSKDQRPQDYGSPSCQPLQVNHDQARGRITVTNNILSLEFGYKAEAVTNGNQSGGNLYRLTDKRYAPQMNIIAVWAGGSGDTGAYASGAGGIGSTQLYAIDDINSLVGDTYQYSISDNDEDGVSLAAPTIQQQPGGALKIIFQFGVDNRKFGGRVRWYEVVKTWTIPCDSSRISLRHDWKITRGGWFSEPASRHQVVTAWTTVSRWGHEWSEPPAGKPGSNSRLNAANKWFDFTLNPTATAECGGWMDGVHSDFIRFHGGPAFDFWFWPDNGGLGYEGLGLYKIGYAAMGQSADGAILEICHHNRALVGDGADAVNLCPSAWWGGDGATADRFKPLTAGLQWTDTYQMEARPPGIGFPVSFP